VIGQYLGIEFSTNPGDLCGGDFRFQESGKQSSDLASGDALKKGVHDEILHLGLEALIALKDTGLKAGIPKPWDLEILHEPELSVKAAGVVPITIDRP